MSTKNEGNRVPPPTARVEFRWWRDEDLPLARALWGDAAVTRHIGGPWNDDQIRLRLEAEGVYRRLSGVQYWPIFERADGVHIGCCGLRPFHLSDDIFELGAHIRPEHWRRGYAFEACQAVTEFAFAVLEIELIVAGHNPGNDPSRLLIEKLGFRYWHDEIYGPTGDMHPTYRLARRSRS